MWFIGVKVEQETSAPPPKKNPGSAHGSVFRLTVWLQKGPSIFNLGLTVFQTETYCFWTGTHDFLQDESRDSP